MRLTGRGLLPPPRRKRTASATPGVSRKCLRSAHAEEVIVAADTGAEGVSTVRQAGTRGCGSDESCRSVTQVLLTPTKAGSTHPTGLPVLDRSAQLSARR